MRHKGAQLTNDRKHRSTDFSNLNERLSARLNGEKYIGEIRTLMGKTWREKMVERTEKARHTGRTLSPKFISPTDNPPRTMVKCSHERKVRSLAKATLGSTLTGRAIRFAAVLWRRG